MILLELFSGRKMISKTFEAQGFDVFNVDINPDLLPSLCADVMTLDSPSLVEHCEGHPNVVWASPDCTQWSWARGAKNEFRQSNTEPLSQAAQDAIEQVKYTLLLIEQLNPQYWFLENPDHGALADQSFMKRYPSFTVAYCQYGRPYRKLTKIWGKFPPSWHPLTKCHHHSHPNIKGFKDAQARSEVPFRLAYDIARACKKDWPSQIPDLELWTV